MSKKIVTITVANHKGGVGKTTTAVNGATYFARLGYPTVLVDIDPQGHVAKFLDLEASDALYDLIVARGKPIDVTQRYKNTKLAVITNTAKSIKAIETLLLTGDMLAPETALKKPLAQFASPSGKPTVVFIDTSPTITAVQLMAINAADWLLVPATPTYASGTGVVRVCQTARKLREQGAGVDLLGIVPTMLDGRYKGHAITIPEWEEKFPGLVLPTVRRLSVVEDATAAGVSLWEHAPKSEAANEYKIVMEEIRRRVGI